MWNWRYNWSVPPNRPDVPVNTERAQIRDRANPIHSIDDGEGGRAMGEVRVKVIYRAIKSGKLRAVALGARREYRMKAA